MSRPRDARSVAMRIDDFPERKALSDRREDALAEVERVSVDVVNLGSRRDSRRERRVAEDVDRVKIRTLDEDSEFCWWMFANWFPFVMKELDFRSAGVEDDGEESESLSALEELVEVSEREESESSEVSGSDFNGA